MPIYEYVCSNCGHRLEMIHSIHGHGPSACPQCGGSMKKAFSAPAVHYKGTGWARKEGAGKSRSSRPKDAESSSGGGPASESSSSGGTAESGSGGSADSGPTKSDSSAS